MSKQFTPALRLVAAAAALFSGAAMAQSSVTLYGQADMFVGSKFTPSQSVAPGAPSGRSFVADPGGMQTSYWGIKGTEDLGSGLKAIFDLNGFYRVDNGKMGRFDGDAMFTRNAFVGLQGNNWGTVKLGRNTTPYFVSTILFNPLIDSYVFSPMVFHTYLSAGNRNLTDPGIVGDSGWNNSVLYTTPDFGGLQANFMYGFGERAGNTGSNKWGGNLMYFNGPFAATVAYQQVKFDSTPGDLLNGGFGNNPALVGFDKQSAVLAGASYDFRVVKVFVQGQYIKSSVNNNPAGDLKHTNGQAGVSVPIGAGSLLASYGYDKSKNDVASFNRNTAAVAYDYNLSKRTDVYAAYFYDKLSDSAHGDTFGVGMRHKF